ncbi:MAG: ABC transporter ATP-binding protein, partial [Mycolicibacterium sp.]|nr:ABC transporter ATP-binding protein [Mycolicibacterium sp.]
MTATEVPRLDIPDDDSADRWRGRVRDNDDDGSPIDETVPRRREARALLGSLLRPYRLTLASLALVVVVENAARLSVPLLVQRGIDHGIPPIVNGGSAR